APGGALRSVGVRVLVGAIGFIAVAIGVVELVVPAVAETAGRSTAIGSVLLAAIAAGSLLGRLVYGGRTWPGTLVQRVRLLVVALVGGLLLVSVATAHLVVFGAALFVGGMFLAPTMICTFQLLDDNAIAGTQVEAQSWLQTSVVFGVAAGTAGAGWVVDSAGPLWALLAGAAAVGIGATVLNASVTAITPGTPVRQRARVGDG
ncbi:MAG: MFS transporter, partial [Nitriliruptoraceae bacterium]